MDAKTIRENEIKPKLVDSFGAALASMLLTKAIAASMKGGTEQEKLQLTIDAICTDAKVVGMWGGMRINQLKSEWLSKL